MQMSRDKAAQLSAHTIFQMQVEKQCLGGKRIFTVPDGLMNKINLSLPDLSDCAPIEDQARSQVHANCVAIQVEGAAACFRSNTERQSFSALSSLPDATHPSSGPLQQITDGLHGVASAQCLKHGIEISATKAADDNIEIARCLVTLSLVMRGRSHREQLLRQGKFGLHIVRTHSALVPEGRNGEPRTQHPSPD